MSVDPSDFIDRSRVSNCCGAPILSPDFCSECHEHCEIEEIDADERRLEREANKEAK